MGRVTEVRVTPEVLRWAIQESGYSVPALAEAAGIDLRDLKAWLTGSARPGVTAVRSLAQTLRRPMAAFLLPKPPSRESRPEVRFRHLPGAPARDLTPDERRFIRKAARLQRMMAWLADELHEPRPRLRPVSLSDAPDAAGTRLRSELGITLAAQFEWPSASAAFDAWRAALEESGVMVLLFQLGADNCRGFSLWHDQAPLVAINTAWNDEARTFTLFHELGHLLTRTNSACTAAAPAAVGGAWDPAERWCERFAAAVLVPEEALRRLLQERAGRPVAHVHDIATVRWLAGRFRASLRAITLRLIELGLAHWDLYRQLPAAADAKRGGGGGKGRDRQEIQEDQLGSRTITLFRRAVDTDVVTRAEALTYLDIPEAALESPGCRIG